MTHLESILILLPTFVFVYHVNDDLKMLTLLLKLAVLEEWRWPETSHK